MRKLTLILANILVVGCASMPDVSVPYFLTKTRVEVTVTQTASCTEGNVPVVATEVAFDPHFSADQGQLFEFGGLGSGLTKANASLELYEDGRLKSINTTQDGQGEETIASILSIAGLLLLDYSPTDTKPACALLRSMVKDKTLTIVYRGKTELEAGIDSGEIDLLQLNVPDPKLTQLLPIFGEVTAAWNILPIQGAPVNEEDSETTISLREPAPIELTVNITRDNKTATSTSRTWSGQHGLPYNLPIQKAPWFGENKMELVLTESGRISKMAYTGGGASQGAISSIDSAAKALSGSTTAEKAAIAKAEADLIYQQQRLVSCQTNPESCGVQ